jgi:hypothetical protein
MCTYLARRGSVYYFRRTIPASLRSAIGRAEFVVSLRTKDRNTAKRLIPTHLIDAEKLLAEAALAAGVDIGNGEPVRLCKVSYKADSPREGAGKVSRLKSRHEAKNDASTVLLDVEVVDGWAAERKPVQKGVDTHRAVARWFYERVGRKCVREITRADVLSFKAKLIAEGATPANIRVKLSRLRTLLQWAADNDLASDNVAKGISIKDAAQARNRRKEFDLESLRRIFLVARSSLLASGLPAARGRRHTGYRCLPFTPGLAWKS